MKWFASFSYRSFVYRTRRLFPCHCSTRASAACSTRTDQPYISCTASAFLLYSSRVYQVESSSRINLVLAQPQPSTFFTLFLFLFFSLSINSRILFYSISDILIFPLSIIIYQVICGLHIDLLSISITYRSIII